MVVSSGGNPPGWHGIAITRHGSTLPVMPNRCANLPDCNAARDGVQIGAADIHCVSFNPSRASESTCGVEMFSRPNTPMSPYPRSSTKRTTKFGGTAAGDASAATNFAIVATNTTTTAKMHFIVVVVVVILTDKQAGWDDRNKWRSAKQQRVLVRSFSSGPLCPVSVFVDRRQAQRLH